MPPVLANLCHDALQLVRVLAAIICIAVPFFMLQSLGLLGLIGAVGMNDEVSGLARIWAYAVTFATPVLAMLGGAALLYFRRPTALAAVLVALVPVLWQLSRYVKLQ